MSVEESPPDEREQQLDTIIAAYYRAVEAGASVDQQDIIAKHPEFQRELNEFFADIGALNAASPRNQQDPALEPTLTLSAAGREKSGRGTVVRYFGEYEILEELGVGGMGVVYKARQSKLKRIVAIKMIRSGELANSQDVQRFEAEARAAAKLSHPGIVSVHEVGIHNGQHFYTMDYVDGGSLAQLLRDEPVPPIRAAKLVHRLAEAMHYAHEQNIVHRDLKPANILLTANGIPRITDFGLAKHVRSEDESDMPTMTETGQILGTAGYMSPEQAAGKSQLVGPSADIYSLGAVLYALLTRRAPFVGETPSQTILQVLQNEPLSPRKIDSGVPRDLETISLKCLEKEPHKRYGTAHLLADDLRLFLEGKPVKARPVSSLERGWRWCRRNSILTALLGVILLVVLCSPIVMWSQVMSIVDGVQDARGAALPGLVAELQKYPSFLATSVLESRLRNASEPHRQLNLAFALADFGRARTEFIISQIEKVSEDSSSNLILSLSANREDSLRVIGSHAATCAGNKLWRRKSRLAILALSLGDAELACDMSRIQDRPDPVERTNFIEELKNWPAIVTRELEVLLRATRDRGLRSAILLGVARMPDGKLDLETQKRMQILAEEWYLSEPESVTHSAAIWLLRKWNIPLPEIPPGINGTQPNEWYRNSQGQTFVLIPSGSFHESAEPGEENSGGKRVIAESFWLADREVTVSQYQRFLEESEDVPRQKAAQWVAINERFKSWGPTLEHPASWVTWYDAVLYCNWVSNKEGLSPAYERVAVKPKTGRDENVEWRPVRGANGYRLPRQQEWEYACRAGTTTEWACGNDEGQLRDYAQCWAAAKEYCGAKLPNGWGLWDMHGNVYEWCDDPWENGQYTQNAREIRGGSFNYPAVVVRSANRSIQQLGHNNERIGIRMARNSHASPGSRAAPSQTVIKSELPEAVPQIGRRPSVLTYQTLIQSDQGFTSVQHTLEGSMALLGGFDRSARLIDLGSRQKIREFPGHRHVVWSVALSPDGQLAVTGSEDHSLRLWEVSTGKELDSFLSHGIFSCVRFSKDGRTIFATNWDQNVRRWNLVNNRLDSRRDYPSAAPSLDIALLPGEQQFAFGTATGSVLLCDTETRIILKTFEGHSGWVHGVAVLSEGKQILSASHDSTVRLWNVETSTTERVYLGHSGKVHEVRVLPGDKYFLSCGEDKTLRLWETTSGRELARGIAKGPLRGLSIAPDGKSCLTAGMPGDLCEWALPETAELDALAASPYVREMQSADALQQDFNIKRKLLMRITDVFISVDSVTYQPVFALDWGPADGTDFIVRHRMLDADLVREEANALQQGFKRVKVKTVTIDGVNRHIGLWTKVAAP